jgi:ABC-type antimicrobial peptide transport system permease subunit
VIREALRLALVGVVLGCGLALAGQHLLRGLLFGVNPWNLWMLAGAVVLVTLVALAAAALPARRAAHADPISALRVE